MMNDRPLSVEQMMGDRVVDELKKICVYLFNALKKSRIKPSGLDIPDKAAGLPIRKAERVQWIRTCLLDALLLKFLYEKKMTDIEQAALKEAAHNGGIINWDQFHAKYGDTPSFSSLPIVLFMTSRGMPGDMCSILAPLIPPPTDVEARSCESLPETVKLYDKWEGDDEVPLIQHATEKAAANDVMIMLHIIAGGKINVSPKTGRPTKAACKTIRKALSMGDFYPEDMESTDSWDVKMGEAGIRPFAWPLILQAGGLVRINGSKLELSRTGKAAMTKPAHDVIKNLWERWLKNKIFHEMSRIEVIKGQKSRKRPLYVAAGARRGIADALAHLEEGGWMQTGEFFTFLIAKGHEVNVVRDDWPLYIAEAHYGSLGYNHVTWEQVEGRFARAFLLEYAATLGLVDVALIPPWGALRDFSDLWGADEYSCLSRYDGLYALRLNALGAWVFRKKDVYIPSVNDSASLTVLPNMEITSLGAVAPSDELFLDRFCKRKSDRVWQLALGKLLQAVSEGVDISGVIDFLSERNNGPLPQPVDAFLQDAARRVGMVQDAGEARLVRCADKITAKLIANDSRLKDCCMPAGNNYLVVFKDKESQFRKKLIDIGFALNSQGGLDSISDT